VLWLVTCTSKGECLGGKGIGVEPMKLMTHSRLAGALLFASVCFGQLEAEGKAEKLTGKIQTKVGQIEKVLESRLNRSGRTARCSGGGAAPIAQWVS
jgi:hypothetical protein